MGGKKKILFYAMAVLLPILFYCTRSFDCLIVWVAVVMHENISLLSSEIRLLYSCLFSFV